MRRTLVAAFIAAVLLLTGCQTASPESRVAPPPPAMTTLKLGTYGNTDHDRMLDILIAAFQADYPQYRVEKLSAGSDQGGAGRLRSMASKGEIDLALSLDPDMAGHLRPLDPWLAKSQVDLAPLGRLLDGSRVDGRVLGLPFTFEPMLLVYNTEVVKTAGITIPTDHWTWDQFRESARRLTSDSGENRSRGVHADVPDWLPRCWIEAKTGRPAWESDPKIIAEALQFFAIMVHSDRALSPAQPGKFTDSRSEYGYTISPLRAFNRREAAMSVESYVSLHALPDRVSVPWALAPFPSLSGARPVIPGHLVSLGITVNSSHPDEAWEFLKFAGGPAGAVVLASAGYLPVYRTDAVQAAWTAGPMGRIPGVESVWNGVWQDADPWRSGSGHLVDPFSRAVNQTLSGAKTLEDAMAEYQQRISRPHR